MKKFMFSALACVAFAFSGFASNGEIDNKTIIFEQNEVIDLISFNEDEKSPCRVTIVVVGVDQDGNPYQVDSGTYYSKERGSGCLEWATGKVKGYEKKYPNELVKSVITST